MKKIFTQIILYLFEVIIVTLFIISIYSKIEKDSFFCWTNNFLTLDFVSDFGVIFVVYQIIIYAFFTLTDSARVDALIKINSVIKSTLLILESNQTLEPVKNELNYLLIEKKNYYMFSKKDIEHLKQIEFLVNSYEENIKNIQEVAFKLNYLVITIDHYKEFHQLFWRNSILLRLLK